MPVGVFISWSGPLSQKLGEALRDWLPGALQSVRPYFSPQDIEKGSRWSTEISTWLAQTNVGIICVTRENTEKPWIMFEAGALSKSLDKSNVCPLLFNLEPAEVKGPLATFQATKFCRDDFKRLVETINGAAGDSRLNPKTLDNVFDTWWPKLDEKISSILREEDKGDAPTRRTDRDMIEEILELARLNTRQFPERGLNPRVLSDLIGPMAELTDFLAAEGRSEAALRFLEQVERPLAHICRRSGHTDLLHRLFPKNLYRNRAMHSVAESENWPIEREAAPEGS